MAEELNEDPQWEITVRVPMRLPVEMRHDLFEAVAQAVARWEPVQRDGWDADVFGLPTDDRLSYRDSQLLLWLHAEAVWQRDQLDSEALKWTEVAGEHAAELESERKIVEQWERGHQDNVLPYTASLETEIDRLRREVEFEANGTNPSREDSADLEALETYFHDRALRRAESGGSFGDRPQCDGDCGNDDCHMTSAVAAWQMAAAAVRRRINEASEARARPQCVVHPDSPEIATPDEWCRRLNVTVHDPDGWRRGGKSWTDPITRAEFQERIAWSSVSMPVLPEGGDTA